MTRDEILAAVERIAREALDYDGELVAEARLVEDLGLDSIRLLTLATEVEDHFRICLDEEDEATIVTAADLAAVVERKLAEDASFS
jgi:acyl carrier protein